MRAGEGDSFLAPDRVANAWGQGIRDACPMPIGDFAIIVAPALARCPIVSVYGVYQEFLPFHLSEEDSLCITSIPAVELKSRIASEVRAA
jgi:hypothetical protein